MTGLAFFAKIAFVRVDRLVTIETSTWRLSENDVRQVTACARDGLVRVLELIV